MGAETKTAFVRTTAGALIRRSHAPRPSRRSAFTLVELLVVIAISSVLLVSLATFTRTSLDTTAAVQDQDVCDHTGRTALARLAREAGLAKTILSAQEYSLSFVCTDITGDGADDALIYSWDGETQVLSRSLNGSTETFAEHVPLFLLEYQYETEDQVSIASPGDVLPLPLAQFSGVSPADGYDEEDLEDISISVSYATWHIEQTFENFVEAPTITSLTVRAKALEIPPPVDTYVTLDHESVTLATGWLNRSQLTTTLQDVTIPMTWTGGTGRKMELGKTYRLRFRPGGYYPYRKTSCALLYQTIKDGSGLGKGLTLSYWDKYGVFRSLGDMASLYFTVRGNLPVTTPSRSTVPVSVLKTIKATIRVIEGAHTAEHSRTCRVSNL